MSEKHVDLLLKAIAVPESCSIYLCDRIRFVTGDLNDFPEYTEQDFHNIYHSYGKDLCNLIKENINYKFSFDDTQYARDGMTREEWVETILVPLAIALPEEN